MTYQGFPVLDLEAFRNQLAVQRGKHVSGTAFLTLDSAAEQLIAVL